MMQWGDVMIYPGKSSPVWRGGACILYFLYVCLLLMFGGDDVATDSIYRDEPSFSRLLSTGSIVLVMVRVTRW